MADKRITDLPLILSGDISSLDVLPIVNVELDITNKVTANQLKAYINSGFTDVFVTGGTYDNNLGELIFTNNTGGTFNINGLFTGNTDVFVTGGTYSAGTATFTNNTGGTFNVSGFTTGDINFANTDLTFTGNRYHNINGNELFIYDLGGLDAIGPYIYNNPYLNYISIGHGGREFLDIGDVNGTSGFTFTTNYLKRMVLDVNGNLGIGINTPTEKLMVSGNTNITGTLNIGTIGGGLPIINLGLDSSGYVVTGGTSTGDYLPLSGGTVTGDTIFTQGLSATTISATTISGGTLYGDGSNLTGIPDYYLTGLTFDNGTYFLKAFVNDGNTYQANLSILGGDLRVTGGTYNPATGIGTFTNNSGATFDVSGFLTGYTDHYVTGFTYDNINTFNIYDNSGNTFSTSINNLSASTVSATTISATTYQNLPDNVTGYYLPLSGGTVTGVTIFTSGLTANTISATTIGSSGDCVDDIYVSNIHSCSPLNINPLNEGSVYFGSTSGVTIDPTNSRVGVGTSIPQTSLELVSNNTSSVGNILRFRDSDTVVSPLTEQFIGKVEFFSNENPGGGGIGVKSYVAGVQDANANSSIIFATTGSTGSLTGTPTNLIGERMRIDSVGNVGIGTNSPTAKFHINNTTTGNTILIEDSTNPDATPFVVDASGNTSIGSTTFTQHISTGSRPTLQVSYGSSGVSNFALTSTPLVIQSSATTTVNMFSPNAAASQFVFGSPSDSFASILRYTPTSKQLLLSTNSTGGYVDLLSGNGLFTMRVSSGQTVGIGVLNPTEKLEVSGKTKTTNLQVTSGATNGYVLISDASGNATWQAPTGLTINNNTNDQLLTASGLANTVNGETNATFNGITLNLDKNSASPNIIVGDAGVTSDAYIRFETTAGSTPTYAIGADKSDLNKFKITYDTSSNASPSIGSTRLEFTTGGTTNIPLVSGSLPALALGASGATILVSSTSTALKLWDGSTRNRNTSFEQYAGYAAWNANVSGTSGSQFFILNDVTSGTTIFGGKEKNDEVVIYHSGRTEVNGGYGVSVRSNLAVEGTTRIGSVSGSGVAVYRNAGTGILSVTSSDERLKKNIEPITGATEIIKNLTGVYFDWKDNEDFQSGDETRQIGLIAQDVEPHLPEAVTLNGNKDYKTVKYSEMVSVLIEAIKEQQQQIDNLKSEIEDLKVRL